MRVYGLRRERFASAARLYSTPLDVPLYFIQEREQYTKFSQYTIVLWL
jgi:hypothetical protein